MECGGDRKAGVGVKVGAGWSEVVGVSSLDGASATPTDLPSSLCGSSFLDRREKFLSRPQ